MEYFYLIGIDQNRQKGTLTLFNVAGLLDMVGKEIGESTIGGDYKPQG